MRDLLKAIWRRDVRTLPSVVLLIWAIGIPVALMVNSLWLTVIAAPLAFCLVKLAIQIWDSEAPAHIARKGKE